LGEGDINFGGKGREGEGMLIERLENIVYHQHCLSNGGREGVVDNVGKGGKRRGG